MNYKKILVVWTVLNLGIVLGFASLFNPFVDPDSCEYIAAAQNLKAGYGLSILADITQIEKDLVPLSLFPAGFPVAIYAGSFILKNAVSAAVLIPRMCFVVLPALLFGVLSLIGSEFFALLIAAAAVFMYSTINWAFLAMSDLPFQVTTLFSFWLLFTSFRKKDSPWVLNGLCLVSGIAAGFALAMRNVGYGTPLAIAAGLTAGLFFRLISPKTYWQIAFAWGCGFLIGYLPFVLRNLILFKSLQPYEMPPSTISFAENVRYYLFAIVYSFTGLYQKYAREAAVLIAGVSGITFFVLIVTKRLGRIRDTYPFQMLAVVILFFYLVFGSFIVIYARTKYQWGELISLRHLLQYNWIYLAGIGGVFALIFQVLLRFGRLDLRIAAVCLLVVFWVPQWRFLSFDIKYHDITNAWQEKYQERIIKEIGSLPEGTYVVSTPWPALKIFSKTPVREMMYDEISPVQLAAKICVKRPLAVVLERSFIRKSNYSSWQDAMDGQIPDGYGVQMDDPEFLILVHPQRDQP